MVGQVIQPYYVRVLSVVSLSYSASVAGKETLNSIHTYSYICLHIKNTVAIVFKRTDSRNKYSGMRY